MFIGRTLTYEIKNNIGWLILNNPPGNVMNTIFFNELYNLCVDSLSQENFRGLIIAGHGRHFSSGAQLDELFAQLSNKKNIAVPHFIKKNTLAFKILYQIKKPVVALLKGICYGSGMELALCADIRLAAPNTLIALPETSFGIMPGLGGIHTLYNKIGTAKTLELIMSNKTIFSEEAHKLGLVDGIYSNSELEHNAMEIINNGCYPLNRVSL